jgi:hypothetical protein
VSSDQDPHRRRRERRFRLLGSVGVGKRNKRQRLDARREGDDRDAEGNRSRESAGSNSRDGGIRSEWGVATNQVRPGLNQWCLLQARSRLLVSCSPR